MVVHPFHNSNWRPYLKNWNSGIAAMNQLDTTLGIINDLIEVNGQRIWNYQVVLKGHSGAPNPELYGIFEQIVEQGQRFQEALELQFVELAHDLPVRGHPTGVILRAWKVVKMMFAETASMSPCVLFDKGEQAMLKAYDYAAKQVALMPWQEVISGQRHELLAFYRRYKSLYRDRQLA